MARNDSWKSHWFLGLAEAFVVLGMSGTGVVQSLERETYDLGPRASSRVPSERIAVIAKDDTSTAKTATLLPLPTLMNNVGWVTGAVTWVRVTDSSRARTGLVSGMPADISPEQLAGREALVIDRALAKQKEDRFKTGEEMVRPIRDCDSAYGAVDVAR